MPYVLGLDLGTSSIGIAAFSLNAQDTPESLIDHHVYLFKEPVTSDTKGLISKKAGRRKSRQERKQRDRRTGRLQGLAQLCRQRFTPTHSAIQYDDTIALDIQQYQSLALRAHATQYPVALTDMTAIVLHLSKSRGYSSGFKKLSSKQNEKLATEKDLDQRAKILTGDVQPGHDRLQHLMQQRRCRTVGQYMLDRAKRGLPAILKASERLCVAAHTEALSEEIQTALDNNGHIVNKFHNLYALRDEIKQEFELIWQQQAKFHPELTPQLYKRISEILFQQRPLKTIAPMVGGCLLEKNLPRSSRAHPAFQTFRIEKQLADLRWGYGRRAKPLNSQELSAIRQALHDPLQLDSTTGELSFQKIYKILKPIRLQAGEAHLSENLNLANGGRESLKGHVTNLRWYKLGLYDAWQTLAKKEVDDPPHRDRQTWVINFLTDLGSPEALYADDWVTQFRLPDLSAKSGQQARQNAQGAMFKDAAFIQFIDQFRRHDKFDRLAALGFDSGRASYSIKALKRLSAWIIEIEPLDSKPDRIDESKAIEALYQQNSVQPKILDYLANPAKTGNGVVDVALMQVKKVVNHFIAKHGKPRRIVVEMTREMGAGLTQRNEVKKNQNAQSKTHKQAAEAIASLGIPYSTTAVLRYRLAQDQAYQCPYCEGSHSKFGCTEIYDGSRTNIEHIVPRSITQTGLKYSEIVLAHRHCNDTKGDRVPFDAFAFNTAPITAMAKRLRDLKQTRKASLLEMPETPDNKLDDAALNDFCERQFHETAWITKLTASWLRSLGINVECIRGSMTEQLRQQWGLATLIPKARLSEGLPLYSKNNQEGEIKETLIPNAALFDNEKQETPLWHYWNGKKLSPDEFQALQKIGLYRYDKRADHRHHLIDAITIALCDRSLVKKMSDDYKKRSELEAQKPLPLRRTIRFGRIACPVPNLQDQAMQAVQQQAVTHRPDRDASGAWLQDTAYGLYLDKAECGQPYLTRRTTVNSLIGKDHAETIANIASVIGVEIRQTLESSYQAFYATQRAAGLLKSDSDYKPAMENLWNVPLLHPRLNRPIHKIKHKYKKFEPSKHMIIEHQQGSGSLAKTHHKILITDQNAYVAWNPSDSTEPIMIVNNYQARIKQTVPKHWKRIYKGDTIVAKNGLRYVVKGLNEAGNRIETMRHLCATPGLKTSQKEGRQDFLLAPAKKKGSLSLWDIVEIVEDPFHGRRTSAYH